MLYSHLHLGLPKGLFPVGSPVKILKLFLPSSILAKCPAHFNLLGLITLAILGNGKNYELFHIKEHKFKFFKYVTGKNVE